MIINLGDKDIGLSNISTLIRKLSFVFGSENRDLSNVVISFSATKQNPVSALIIFKFFEYQLLNKCLEHPKASLHELVEFFSHYGLEKLFKKLIVKEDAEQIYRSLKPVQMDGFFIAPHSINRDNFKSMEELETKYTKFIKNYYDSICPELVQYFNTCICEIASNFLYHALEDTNSILMAKGDATQIEIVCVDNSVGIISNIDSKSRNHKATMSKAFERGFSSKKKDGHCGTGLWYVAKISEFLNGTVTVYSEDIKYLNRSGRVFVQEVPYWKGSIFHLKLFVGSDKKINEFFTNFVSPNNLGLVHD